MVKLVYFTPDDVGSRSGDEGQLGGRVVRAYGSVTNAAWRVRYESHPRWASIQV